VLRRVHAVVAVVLAAAGSAPACGGQSTEEAFADPSWQKQFRISECALQSTGRNTYFVLEPGFQLVLEGGAGRLAITVLDETKTLMGVTTRVVEEREWKDDELVEVSRNFFAICPTTRDVFYFGEEVDDVQDGQIVGHGGAWLAGENGARPGLIMSGHPRLGMKYYQEVAPDVALDRAEIVSLDESLETPAGVFRNALKTREGSALDPDEREFKIYVRGIGLAHEQALLLAEHGFIDGS
jgi:hypothetical protein